MKRYSWVRPSLPEKLIPTGAYALGWLLTIGGLLSIPIGIATFLDRYDPNPWGMTLAMYGAGAAGSGMLYLALTEIVVELRRQAFEAALRSGDQEVSESTNHEKILP